MNWIKKLLTKFQREKPKRHYTRRIDIRRKPMSAYHKNKIRKNMHDRWEDARALGLHPTTCPSYKEINAAREALNALHPNASNGQAQHSEGS